MKQLVLYSHMHLGLDSDTRHHLAQKPQRLFHTSEVTFSPGKVQVIVTYKKWTLNLKMQQKIWEPHKNHTEFLYRRSEFAFLEETDSAMDFTIWIISMLILLIAVAPLAFLSHPWTHPVSCSHRWSCSYSALFWLWASTISVSRWSAQMMDQHGSTTLANPNLCPWRSICRFEWSLLISHVGTRPRDSVLWWVINKLFCDSRRFMAKRASTSSL